MLRLAAGEGAELTAESDVGHESILRSAEDALQWVGPGPRASKTGASSLMTHRRRRPAIAVEVPARQRRVLDAFFAGHLPAGQLDRALAAAAEMDTAEVEAALVPARSRITARRLRRIAA